MHMNAEFNCEKLVYIKAENFTVPFTEDNYGFFIEENEDKVFVQMKESDEGFVGNMRGIDFLLSYIQKDEHLEINVRLKNNGEDFDGRIGFVTGVDSCMISYPQWNDLFFPTLLRCEKTHLWGYYMNPAGNSLAIATSKPVASYDLSYNEVRLSETSIYCGHRVYGSNIYFYQNTPLPERHPDNLKVFKSGHTYTNTIYLIPVEEKSRIKEAISKVSGVPTIDAPKYTLEKGEVIDFKVDAEDGYTVKLISPKGKECNIAEPLEDYGVYTLTVTDKYDKTAEAKFYVRREWDYYLEMAAKNALSKPPRATTHAESYYGFFSMFLYYKHTGNKEVWDKACEAFWEVMPYMFDFDKAEAITEPDRIQNTSTCISILVDMYEADKENRLDCLKYASDFAEIILNHQDATGAFRNKKVHYTCVIYIAKSMLELVQAEKASGDKELMEKAKLHYDSVKRAVDELVLNLDNIETEGEMTLEDGMISCSALQIGMFALTLPEDKRDKYIKAAEYMLSIHSCLEQQLIPDSRMNGASLRFWESQYDVMIRANMFNSPHGWTGWTLYAHYYLYMLTGKKKYLMSLMNGMGAGCQLVDENGDLRWGFCAAPYIKTDFVLVPDYENEIRDGYNFVESDEKAYRGKYIQGEVTEGYIDMISGWYRTGEQRVTGGYEWCSLTVRNEERRRVDNQGGCCDNDVHEIFKCLEETVLRKAFIHQNDDGSFITFGCKVIVENGILKVTCDDKTEELVYSVKDDYKAEVKKGFYELSGFGTYKV